jgi:MFS family permease
VRHDGRMRVRAADSGWAPLASPLFRALWLAQLGSNVGTWMQTVGAQWLLVDVPHAAQLVALVQTASLAPTLLLVLPAGVLTDVVDRRWLLVGTQAMMAGVAAVIAALTATGVITAGLLLALTFLLGCGAAVMAPAWQAIQPELVAREQLAAAAALGGMNVNLARAIGPAVAGVIVAWAGPAAVFGLNAVSFVVVLVVLALWQRPVELAGMRAERVVPALQSGVRYVRYAPAVRRVMLRAALFVVPASALWALLPVVAHGPLRLGATGYGGLLAALGVGAVLGAALLPRWRRRVPANRVLAVASAVFAAATLALALVSSPVVVGALLVFAGIAWLAVLSTLNAAMQLTLAGWVRGRGLAVYQLVFLGGQGVAAFLWGALAAGLGVPLALLISAGLLLACGASVRVLPMLPGTGTLDRTPATAWPEPALVLEPDPREGPVLVLVTYRVPEGNVEAFLTAMRSVGVSRRRTGATGWRVYRDPATPQEFVEVFTLGSWDEHLRQHSDRLTAYDQGLLDTARALADGAPLVRASGVDVKRCSKPSRPCKKR